MPPTMDQSFETFSLEEEAGQKSLVLCPMQVVTLRTSAPEGGFEHARYNVQPRILDASQAYITANSCQFFDLCLHFFSCILFLHYFFIVSFVFFFNFSLLKGNTMSLIHYLLENFIIMILLYFLFHIISSLRVISMSLTHSFLRIFFVKIPLLCSYYCIFYKT